MKVLGGAIGGFLVLLLFVALMGGGPAPEAASAACVPAGAAKAIPDGLGPEVDKAATVAGVPAAVLAAQLDTESGWNARAGSPAGARGLAQFMPATWATWGNGGDPLDPVAAIGAQGRFMGDLLRRAQLLVKGTGTDPVALALAGYNAGWGAVETWHGIPPYAETTNYVARILALARTKYARDGDGLLASARCAATPAGDGDDLPWRNAPTWVQLGAGPAAASPLGMFNRECTDFALWRVNQQLGSTAAPFTVTNSSFRGDGIALGSANTPASEGGPYSWKTGWQIKGWPTGKTPVTGSVVYYAPGVGGADAVYGHVAVVKTVNVDGTYVEEGYNGDPAPNDHRYYTRTVKNTTPSAFLYVPAPKEDFGLAS